VVNFITYVKKNPTFTILLENKEGGNTSKLILWGLYHPDNKAKHRHHKRRLANSMNLHAKIIHKILKNSRTYEKVILHTHV
jgi:hypothetical protein